ncbi:hypothetical protein KY333_01200 [Candidatus Woesearchaeota archaeon]|nr:hypothetical protein [Candidatus Woesearchaeota archaeon]MBW2993817.1 hypothetical protein [Candidatus Woesearchaeota archaeon]
MIPIDVDLQKTRTLLLYLSLAKFKLDERTHARQKLAAQISQLKKISTSSIKKRVTELEVDIRDALAKEKNIKAVQFKEEAHHKALVDKIDKLEKKLGKYMDSKESRKIRIQELEDKIKQRTASRKEKFQDIKVSIKNLEKLYTSAKKDKTVSKMRLKSIQAKIKRLKETLKVKASA